MKTCLDVLGKDPEPQIQQLTTAIGKNIQLELRLTYYATENPELYKQATRFFHPGTGTRQKATVIKLKFNREGIEWQQWNNTVCHKVGQWLLQAMNDETGWIERQPTDQVVAAKPRPASATPASSSLTGTRSWQLLKLWPSVSGRCFAPRSSGPTTTTVAT